MDMAMVMVRDMDIVMDMAMEAIGLMDMVDMEEVMDMEAVMDMGAVIGMEAIMEVGITGGLAILVRNISWCSSGQAQYRFLTSYVLRKMRKKM